MMNYKVAAGFGIGFALGGILGAFLMHKKDIKEVNDALNEIRKDVEEFDRKNETDISKKNDYLGFSVDPRPDALSALKDQYVPDSLEKTEYSEEEFNKIESGTDIDGTGNIFVIGEADYFDGGPYYGKEHLYYFKEDGVVTNDEFEVVTDAKSLCGNIKSYFARQMGDWNEEDPVYIRNETLTCDYEITPKDGMFFGE